MRAKDRKQFTEAWNAHVSALGLLPSIAGIDAATEWSEKIEPALRSWVKVAADRSFPEATGTGELPNGGAS